MVTKLFEDNLTRIHNIGPVSVEVLANALNATDITKEADERFVNEIIGFYDFWTSASDDQKQEYAQELFLRLSTERQQAFGDAKRLKGKITESINALSRRAARGQESDPPRSLTHEEARNIVYDLLIDYLP